MSSITATVKVRRLSSKEAGFEKTLLSSLSIPSADDQAIDQRVLGILEKIRQEGDAALLEFTQQFDRLSVNQVRVKARFCALSRDLMPSMAAAPAQPYLRTIEISLSSNTTKLRLPSTAR